MDEITKLKHELENCKAGLDLYKERYEYYFMKTRKYKPMNKSKFCQAGGCDDEGGYLHTEFRKGIYDRGFMVHDAVDCIGVVSDDLCEVIQMQEYFKSEETRKKAERIASSITDMANELKALVEENKKL